MPARILALEDIRIRGDGHLLIDDLRLCIASGEVVTVMGPSGSGKSTLLAYLCGTLSPDFEAQGRITLNGRRLNGLPPEQRNIGILFQNDLLFPHLSVGSNLAFGLKAQVRGRRARRERIAGALASAGMAGFEARDPATLSGGQRARVAVLRVLLAEPAALLLDEPFSGLDAALRSRFRRFVFERVAALGLPTLLVTHDPLDAEAAGGNTIQIGPRDSD